MAIFEDEVNIPLLILDEEMDDFDGNEIDLSICQCDRYN